MVNMARKTIPCSSDLKTIKIFHQNIRGLRFKFYELLCHLEDKLPLIFCFTEHHLNKEERINQSITNSNRYEVLSNFEEPKSKKAAPQQIDEKNCRKKDLLAETRP
jgi:hypothetical protein